MRSVADTADRASRGAGVVMFVPLCESIGAQIIEGETEALRLIVDTERDVR